MKSLAKSNFIELFSIGFVSYIGKCNFCKEKKKKHAINNKRKRLPKENDKKDEILKEKEREKLRK